jgi:DNA-directed RNA polymerase specialized sigma24 family protein
MEPSDISGLSPYSINPVADNMLEHFQYILYIAKRYVPSYIGPVDSDDVAQEASIKFWLICQKQTIESPKAYIRTIVYTVVADMVRKYKPQLYQALSTDEHGEILESYLINLEEAEQRNPERILELQESLHETMKKLVGAVTELPPRQQHSAVTTLKERIDDLLLFVDVLQENNINGDLERPIERVERQRLQASFSHAQRHIAHIMNIDLDEYL